MAILKIQDENGNFINIPAIKGEAGKSYEITSEDYEEIAQQVIENIQPSLDEKMDKLNPTATGDFKMTDNSTISINRKKNTTIGTRSVAFGTECTASEENAVATGNYTTAKGRHSFAANQVTHAGHDRSAVFGNNTKSSTSDQFVCGMWNDDSVDNSIFQVGYGTGKDNKKNAINVNRTNGNVTFDNDINVSDTVYCDKLEVQKNATCFGEPTSWYDLTNKNYVDNAINTVKEDVDDTIDTVSSIEKKVSKLSTTNFKSTLLFTGDTFTIKPGMMFFFQSSESGVIATVKGTTADNGAFSHDIYGLTFGFCTELGKSHDVSSEHYRMSLNYKDGVLTTDFESKNKFISKYATQPYVKCNVESMYVWYMEKE